MGIHLRSLLDRLPGRAAKVIFVSDTGESTVRTFDDLHRDTVALIAQLEAAGLTRGMRVGIQASSSYGWMRWDLALNAMGCVSVAMLQESRVSPAEIADGLGLALMAVDPCLVSPEALTASDVVDVNAAALPQTKRVRGRPLPEEIPGTYSLAFSSGTTGRTKGLIISAAGTEHLIDLYANAFGGRPGDRFITFLPFSNYQQRMTYYFCLEHGIDFVYTPYVQLFASFRAHKPTFTISPPLFYESVHNIGLSLSGGGKDLAATAACLKTLLGGNIRYLVTGMAPIKKRTLELFWSCDLPLYEAFGITEAGMVAWNKPGAVKVGTVGRPAEAGSVRLTDEGEVVITRDALLSLGYFDASEEDSRNTFVARRSVATGDIAKFDEEGFVVITGRKKDAILARSGEKFHPEPIEALIQRHPGVKAAVITDCDSRPGTTAIVVVAKTDDQSAAQIREHIDLMNADLPACQQVRDVIFTEKEFGIENGLRTRNLKLDRKAIRAAFIGA
jgi:long-chain acyl-CoA synthetase